MASVSIPAVSFTTNCKDNGYDGIVLVTDSVGKLSDALECLRAPLQEFKKVDAGTESQVVLIPVNDMPGGRVVFSPTGPLNRDYDDVRRFSDAAVVGVKRALEAGMKHPLLVHPPDDSFEEASLVTLLGALHALYVPLEIREAFPEKSLKVDTLGIWVRSKEEGKQLVFLAQALENGRIVYRDIGGSDPERMAAPKVAEYVENVFKNSPVFVKVISDLKTLEEDYPCLAAVNRCANGVTRHQARVIKLEYTGEGEVDQTLLLVGKGVTYDTGGADIKAGGIMAGMHRDKCGSAAVAGFFKILDFLRPKKIRVIGAMAMVRNSVGPDCYVADELITSRAQKRIRVGNTDAEGRMAMADVLCEMKEKALSEINPELFTIATLTGHAIRAMGPNYSIIIDNGPARKVQNAQKWQEAGEKVADPFEISTMRREDFEFHKGKSVYEEILQCNNQPSSATPRGHQSPSAFLVMAAGLDQHGIDSDKPLRYSHIDIAGSSGPFPGIPTGAPIVAMAAKYLFGRI
ncbi:putative aminopeptidase W07G4.4 [Latimeria chalumnae]|uniref:Zgc:152830 n=1 Tax=Latimeria chalumnae TaxID=7897 RepID=H3A5H9_LATCH|nr:PREDICTED: putative aminopeptidase W07G4.4 [Latimeria chalumnae]|eukprot:XP_006007579.1 PREDICTED: putative aminopeptidase W07G4.4 [Latimeria chalumnae]